MSVTAKMLGELHELHMRLGELTRALERGPKQIKTKETTVKHLEAELEAARQRKKQAQMELDKKQQNLQSSEAKIASLQTKLNTCSTNKEYQLLQEQIAADEMAKSVIEDEILEAFDKQETLKAAIGASEEHLKKGRLDLEKVKQKVSAETSGLEQQAAAVRGELEAAERALPVEFRNEFQRMVRHRGEDAMARSEENVCTGCYQSLTPNMQAELSMGKVAVCKGCGRLLYEAGS